MAEARLLNGDILVNSTGTGTLGRVGLVEGLSVDSIPVLVADGHVTVIRVSPQAVSPAFLTYLLTTSAFMDLANECLAIGSTNQMELGRESLSLQLNLDPLLTQPV
jgi:type I restriction enzyme S subunit